MLRPGILVQILAYLRNERLSLKPFLVEHLIESVILNTGCNNNQQQG